jgi:type I restriction enzyme S subunit
MTKRSLTNVVAPVTAPHGAAPAAKGLGRFKPYPAYKDSGVEWLGAIPAHWEVKRLKFTVTMNPDVLDEATRPDYEMLYVDVGNVDSTGTIQNAKSLRFENAPTRARRKIRAGDTILSTVRTYLKAIAFVPDPPDNLIVSTGFAVLRPGRNVAPKFLWRLVQSQQFVDAVVSYSEGVGYPAINPSRLGRLVAWLPPLPEQRAIAAFLDRETAKIDALVEKKERLIALLQEKRTALISHAVTKGLDPTAPMKDSGVEWLGEIPAHWEVKRLKRLASVRLSNVDKKTLEGEEPVLLCNYIDVYKNERITRSLEFMPATASKEQKKQFALRVGDVLITKDSESWTDIAVPALVAEDLDGVVCGYHLAHIRPNRDCDGAFLSRVFAAIGPRDQFHVAANGITRYGLSSDAIRSAIIPPPPPPEQRAIAAFLDRETAKIDALIAKVREAIERLKEYRTALISAAVTGKIKAEG